MLCSKHANRMNKAAAKNMHKLTKKNPNNQEKIDAAKMAHSYHNDIYFASPRIFQMLNNRNYRYQKAKYFNKILSKLKNNSKDYNNNTPIQIGNFVAVKKNKILKNKKSTAMIIYKNKKIYKIWDKKNPYEIIEVNCKTSKTKKVKIIPQNKSYGFEYQKRPDYRWAIWYTYINS